MEGHLTLPYPAVALMAHPNRDPNNAGGAQLSGSLRVEGYPYVALLTFSGTRTRLVVFSRDAVGPGGCARCWSAPRTGTRAPRWWLSRPSTASGHALPNSP